MYEPAGSNPTNPFIEYTDMFSAIFAEALTNLKSLYGDSLVLHTLDDNTVTQWSILSYNDLLRPTIATIDEWADYRDIKNMGDRSDIRASVRNLAFDAQDSYYWNVRNAAIKGGSLWSGRLHILDQKSLKVNMVARGQSCCPDGNDPNSGWIAYRYKFAAAKIK